MNTDKPILLNRCSSVFICVHLWPLLFLVFFGKLKRAYLLLKAEAGAAQVDLVAGAQLLAAAVAGGDVDRAAIAEDAGAEFAPVIRDAVFARRKLDVRVLARHAAPSMDSSPCRLKSNWLTSRSSRSSKLKSVPKNRVERSCCAMRRSRPIAGVHIH